MATIALVATPQPDNIPPRVRLDVTATGTPTVTAVTVTRLDPDGRWRRVRTADDGPQPLTSGTATLYDPEAPAGPRSRTRWRRRTSPPPPPPSPPPGRG
jgi:hypothetical protein